MGTKIDFRELGEELSRILLPPRVDCTILSARKRHESAYWKDCLRTSLPQRRGAHHCIDLVW